MPFDDSNLTWLIAFRKSSYLLCRMSGLVCDSRKSQRVVRASISTYRTRADGVFSNACPCFVHVFTSLPQRQIECVIKRRDASADSCGFSFDMDHSTDYLQIAFRTVPRHCPFSNSFPSALRLPMHHSVSLCLSVPTCRLPSARI